MPFPRTSTAAFLLSALIFCTPAAAQFGPMIVGAFSNSPGMITVYWQHRNTSVDRYYIDRRLLDQPASALRSAQASPEATQATIASLTPATFYEVRVCADYSPEVECSHADDQRWVVVKTMDPERPQPPRPVPTAPPPLPIPAPQLTAAAVRERDNGPVVVAMRNINLRSLAPSDRARVAKQTWWRSERQIGEGWDEVFFDRDPPQWTTYKVCLELKDGGRACGAVRAGYLGSAMSMNNVRFGALVTHREGSGELAERVDVERAASASFLLRPGKAPIAGGITFEILGMPRHYFVNHANYLRVMKDDGTPEFSRKATFQVILPARGYAGQNDIFHLESVAARGSYILANYTSLIVAPIRADAEGSAVAAFRFVPALSQPPAMQVRDVGLVRPRDTFMPTMRKPYRRLGKYNSGTSTSPATGTTDPCVAWERAKARAAMPAVVIALEQRCRESKR